MIRIAVKYRQNFSIDILQLARKLISSGSTVDLSLPVVPLTQSLWKYNFLGEGWQRGGVDITKFAKKPLC